MKKHLLVVLLLLSLFSIPVSASRLPDELVSDAILVFREIAEQPDSEQLYAMLKKAHGVAIFPSVIKAGIGVGGRYGEGLILQYDETSKAWYGPYFVTMKGLSYGFQIGIQSTALILVMASERGMESLQEGKITLGGNLSIAAGPIGRSAEAGTDLNLKAAIYSYSLSKGAFVGASFEGAILDNNVNANQVYWQKKLTPAETLAQRASGASIEGLLKELSSIVN
jgi:lipid-binding SYLF domain-containing protein